MLSMPNDRIFVQSKLFFIFIFLCVCGNRIVNSSRFEWKPNPKFTVLDKAYFFDFWLSDDLFRSDLFIYFTECQV